MKNLPPSLLPLAKRYVWWESPEWALAHPEVLLSNIMNLGNWNDILALRQQVDGDTLKFVLLHAKPGVFSPRSWDYWHHKLNVLPIPPLPKRMFE